MMVKNGNNKVTMAKIGQKLDDYIEHNNKNISGLSSKQDKMMDSVNEIKLLLTDGGGKIKGLRYDFNEHKENHKWWFAKILAMTSIVSGIIIAIFKYLI